MYKHTHTLLSLSLVDFISSKIHFMFTRNFYKWMCLKIAFAMVDYYFKKGMFMDTRVMGRRSHDHSRRWLKVRPKAMNALGSLSLSHSVFDIKNDQQLRGASEDEIRMRLCLDPFHRLCKSNGASHWEISRLFRMHEIIRLRRYIRPDKNFVSMKN